MSSTTRPTTTTRHHNFRCRDDLTGATREQAHLGPSGRVLGRTSSHELGFVVVQQVIVQTQMLLLGQYGIIGLEAIFLAQFLSSDISQYRLYGVKS